MCIIRHTVGWSILKKYYVSTCINVRFIMIENSYTHIPKKQFCISGHLVKRLKSFLLFWSSDRCCTPWKVAGSILRYRVLSGCSGHCSNSLVLGYRGSGIYFPRRWNYRNSDVLIRTWNTQIRNSIMKVKHGCKRTIIFLRRVSQHRRIHNLFFQKSYQKRWKLYLWIKKPVYCLKVYFMIMIRIYRGFCLITFEVARGYRKKIISSVL